jgi:opacity protein-like surface antigen
MIRTVVLVAVALAISDPARADSIFSPWVAGIRGRDPATGRRTLGLTAGGMYAGTVGGEADIGFSSNFFNVPVDNSALTMMANLIVGVPLGSGTGRGLRPYFSGGAGLIRTQFDTVTGRDDAQNDLGMNLGGGVMGFLTEHFGVRGDLRHFRSVKEGSRTNGLGPDEPDPLRFWRISIGVIIR